MWPPSLSMWPFQSIFKHDQDKSDTLASRHEKRNPSHMDDGERIELGLIVLTGPYPQESSHWLKYLIRSVIDDPCLSLLSDK